MNAVKHNVADLLWKSPGSDIEILSLNFQTAISELYIAQLQIKSKDPALSFDQMLNAEAEIVIKAGAELTDDRKITGIITRFGQARTRHGNLPNATGKNYLYDVEIRPKLWLLTRQFRSFVHQQMTAKDIVTKVCDDAGIAHTWQVQGAPPQREYCVQYEETDYNFISRLLEDEGICYYFDHDEKKVIFSDHVGGHKDTAPVAEATYVEEVSPRMAFGKQEFVRDFTYEEQISTGEFAVNHYNYETSQTNILAKDQEGEVPNFKSVERYEHSQNYKDKGAGTRYVGMRKEEATATGKSGRGSGSCRSFDAGRCFTLKDHFRGDLNTKWLLTACAINAEQGSFRCHFTALAADVPYRPPRDTPRPRVYGLQTATITGPSGAKVYLDKMGRCKLQFHWDREGGKDDRASMWVRVSNNYAGKDYGVQFIPRVGHEVLVTFIDGDPDLPVVTGRVYNDFNTAPLGPAGKWRNMIKTIKDNHIIFDDEDGKELVDVRSQKDMKTEVVNNDTQQIGANRSVSVGWNHKEKIGNDMTIDVAKNLTETVGVDYTETIAANHIETIGANATTTIGASHVQNVGGAQMLSVGSAKTETVALAMATQVGAAMSVSVGAAMSTDVGAAMSFSSGAAYSVSAGGTGSLDFGSDGNVKTGRNFKVDAGSKVTIQADDQITLKCGGASITLKKSGDITIKGKKITAKSSGAMTLKGSKIKEN